MANLKSAIKYVSTSKKKRINNNEYKASMKTAIKKVEQSILNNNKDEAKNNLQSAIKKIDSAISKKVIHQNKGARHKSRLTKKVNKMN